MNAVTGLVKFPAEVETSVLRVTSLAFLKVATSSPRPFAGGSIYEVCSDIKETEEIGNYKGRAYG